MATRMDRHDRDVNSGPSRSSRNRVLYDASKDQEIYSNIEGFVATPNPDEVDISKLQEVIKRKEEASKRRRQLVSTEVEVNVPESELFEADKNYDIRDVLTKAKVEQEADNNEHRKLKNTEYDILKSLKIQNKELESLEAEKELAELKEMMHTLTGKEDAKELGDTDLSLNLLSDLKANTLVNKEPASIKTILAEAKKQYEGPKDEEDGLDKSFYTNSNKFLVKDFTDALEKDNKKAPKPMTLVIILNVLILVTIIVFALYTILK